MAFKALLLAAVMAQTATAHFRLNYPPWRADSLAAANSEIYSQWTYPCANAPYQAGNITDWPLSGGSLQLGLHHPWTYLFVNLGLGANTTNFNISLTPEFLNVTGNGTFCIHKLPVPIDVADGSLASLQVVTLGESGSALYNCADIRFSKDAKTLSNCTSSDGVVSQVVEQQNDDDDDEHDGDGNGGNGTNGGNTAVKNAAASPRFDSIALVSVLALTMAYAFGLGM